MVGKAIYTLRSLWLYLAAMTEVLLAEPARSPEIIAKLFRARRRQGYGPDTFFYFDLQNRPEEVWGSFLPYDPKIDKIMYSINQVQHYGRHTFDKVRTAEILHAAGVATPPVIAVVGRNVSENPVHASVPVFNDQAGLVSFLDSPECPDKLFSKPVGGQFGAGAIVATRGANGWHLGDSTLNSAEFAKELLRNANGKLGRMLQTRLKNHPDVIALTGDVGLSTLRIITARSHDGVRPVAAVQKLIGKDADTDNFAKGTSGNVVASVDLTTGTLGHCIGRKPGRRFLIDRFPDHPFTGARVEGVRLPQWKEALDTVREAARAFVHQPFLGFDLAFTDRGPMILEANSIWNWSLTQAVTGKGGKTLFLENLADLDITEEGRTEALRIFEQVS